MNTSSILRHIAYGALLGTVALSACSKEPSGPQPPDAETIAKLTITAVPGTPSVAPTIGISPLGIGSPRDGFMYVPTSYSPATPAPLMVLLHGAGGDADFWNTESIRGIAEGRGMVVLAIDSRYETWDGTQLGRYDVDVAFLNQALLHVYARVSVDPARIAIGGFSDGASWALGVGIANAGVFRKIVAFTPGGLNAPFSRGEPDVFLAHGLDDDIIPYTNSRDFIAPRLRANGMEVLLYFFEGGHEIQAQVEAAGFNWLFEPPTN